MRYVEMRLEQLGAPRKTFDPPRKRISGERAVKVLEMVKAGLPPKRIAAALNFEHSPETISSYARSRGLSLLRIRHQMRRRG